MVSLTESVAAHHEAGHALWFVAMSPQDQTAPQAIRQLRIVVASSIGLLTALLLVLPTIGPAYTATSAAMLAIPAVAGLADLFLIPAVGSTVRPLPASTTAQAAALISAGVLRTLTMLRFALAEAPALVGLAVAFITDSGLPYAVGYAFSVVLLALAVYPSERVVNGVRERLEANGVRSEL